MKTYFNAILTTACLLTAANCSAQLFVKPDNKNIAYMGRIKPGVEYATFYWPGTSATINFKGTGVKATLKSLKEQAFFYAITDNDESKILKISSDSVKSTYQLAANLPFGRHSVKLYKITNCTSDNLFYGFEIDKKGEILKQAEPLKRKIEFYGNSITAGHGVDAADTVKNSGAPPYYNNYYTYGALTSRHFNAQYSCIARGGIGIMVSWFPEIMPEIYDRSDPFNGVKKWDFATYTPDIVVINLFQNDSWLLNMPDNEQFKARFGKTPPTEEFIVKSYQNFVTGIRAKYPTASIICVLGNMDATKVGSKWPGYIEKAVKNLHDKKMYTLFFPFKNTPGHPNREAQQLMANDLITFINNKIKW